MCLGFLAPSLTYAPAPDFRTGAIAASWFSIFLLCAFRRIDIRIVRFWRSTNEVLMCLGSRLPCGRAICVPMHSPGAVLRIKWIVA